MLTTRSRRPIILVLLTLLLLLKGLAILTLSILSLLGLFGVDVPEISLEVTVGLYGGLGTVLGVGFLLAAFGTWRLRPWAWQLTMVLIGVQLLADLWAHFDEASVQNSVALALNILIVFYLVQKDVRVLFAGGQDTAT